MLYMLQEKDSSLTKIFLLQTKNFLKKITDNAWKIYFKQQGKLHTFSNFLGGTFLFIY